MIVWGWKTVFRVIGSGVFSCPACGADRNYERRRAQRFFTLFFIPLIPLKTIGEFVRCTYCKNDFRDSVLARPTAAQFTDLLQNTVRGVMVNVLRRGGWEHPGARAVAVQEIVTAGAVGYGEPNLAQDMQVVPEDLTQLLANLAGQLPEAGREALVTGATRVAAADGPVQPAERAVIDAVGAALGMSQAHVAGIVAAVAPAAPGMGQAPMGQPPMPPMAQQQVPPQAFASGQQPVAASAPGGQGMETMLIQAPQPAQPSSMETMLVQAPQPMPAVQDAVPPQVPAAGGSGMETMLIQAPQPSSATGARDVVPPQPQPSSMETMLIPAPQPPSGGMHPTVLDPSGSMETMAIPFNQIPHSRPVESAEEPTHVTESEPAPQQYPWGQQQQ
jgi:tellurite resistance protein